MQYWLYYILLYPKEKQALQVYSYSKKLNKFAPTHQ